MSSDEPDAAFSSKALFEDLDLPGDICAEGKGTGGADGDFISVRLEHFDEVICSLRGSLLDTLLIGGVGLSETQKVLFTRVDGSLGVSCPWMGRLTGNAIIRFVVVALGNEGEGVTQVHGGWSGELIDDPGDVARVGVEGFHVVV